MPADIPSKEGNNKDISAENLHLLCGKFFILFIIILSKGVTHR